MPACKHYLAKRNIKPQDDYLLLLTFENGAKRQFDMKPYLDFGVFKELKEMNMFNTVKPSFDAIEWENEADFDPEILYLKSIKID